VVCVASQGATGNCSAVSRPLSRSAGESLLELAWAHRDLCRAGLSSGRRPWLTADVHNMRCTANSRLQEDRGDGRLIRRSPGADVADVAVAFRIISSDDNGLTSMLSAQRDL
jgi:hypothetical protein